MEPKFKVGDKVKAFGLNGTVISSWEAIVEVSFCTKDDGFVLVQFNQEGLQQHWHAEPSLELVERPRKRVKKKLYIAIADGLVMNLTRAAHRTSFAYEDRVAAENQFTSPHQVVEVEIEVDEK